MLSAVNELPAGSPVSVTIDMPPGKLTWMYSLGELPRSPESASLFENRDTAEATKVLVESNTSTVNGTAYVKYPAKLSTGAAKLMAIGPPSSNATFPPEYGGNSYSLSDMPAVIIVAFVNVRPGYCVVSEVPSAKPSKSITPAANWFGTSVKARIIIMP